MWIEIPDGFVNTDQLSDIRFDIEKEIDSNIFWVFARLYYGGTRGGEILLSYEDKDENRFNYVKNNLLKHLKKRLSFDNTEVLNLYKEADEYANMYNQNNKEW